MDIMKRQQMNQIAEEEEKERKYYAAEVAKLLEEEEDSKDDSTSEQLHSPAKVGTKLQSKAEEDVVVADAELSMPNETQVNQCIQGDFPGMSNSITFISETPEILIIKEALG